MEGNVENDTDYIKNVALEFVHTSDIESLNSLVLKYCSKKDSYRYIMHERPKRGGGRRFF